MATPKRVRNFERSTEHWISLFIIPYVYFPLSCICHVLFSKYKTHPFTFFHHNKNSVMGHEFKNILNFLQNMLATYWILSPARFRSYYRSIAVSYLIALSKRNTKITVFNTETFPRKWEKMNNGRKFRQNVYSSLNTFFSWILNLKMSIKSIQIAYWISIKLVKR